MNKFAKKVGTGILVSVLSLSAVNALASITDINPSNSIVTNVYAKDMGHIKINAHVSDDGTVQSLAGKKFNVYRIFDAENAKNMESINYTANPTYLNSLKKVTGKDTEYAVIDYIQSLNNNLVINDVSHTQENESRYSQFRYFVENLRNQLVEDKASPTQVVTVPSNATDSYTLEVAYGWYLIDEVTDVEDTHSASSLCMVNTANPDVTIDIKSDYPTIKKQIKEDDNQDKIGVDKNGWNDIGDYEIGQTVPYRYLSNVPDLNGYQEYYFAMHDRMDKELTFNADSVTVKIGDKTLVKDVDYKVVQSGLPAGETFQIQITDLKATVNKYFYSNEANANPETEKKYGQEIVVEYNATLNDSAQLTTGRPGFENDVKLEFSNNPDSDGQGQTGETPWDTVVAFTFKTNGVKVNDQNPELKLEGAKFRLYSDKECKNEVYVKKATATDGYIVINRDSVTGNTAPDEAVEMVSDKNGMFNIIGLDSQTYYLKETVAPDGYRLLKDPIQIDIKATYAEQNRDNYIKGDGATDKTLQKLEATAHFKEFYNQSFNEYDNNLTTSVEDGSINLKVVNKVGSKLPATGSIATIILIGAGTAIMGSVLIKNRKKEVEE